MNASVAYWLALAQARVTVAEWLRRQTVDLSTRVRFPPVTPELQEAHDDEQTILNRQAASSILARPSKFCRVAELVQRSIVNREDVGSSPTPTANTAEFGSQGA